MTTTPGRRSPHRSRSEGERDAGFSHRGGGLDGVIGNQGDLPWHLPADLKHFKQTTLGHHVLMGRKTWESIGNPLPGRRILVLSARGLKLDLPLGTEEGAVTVVGSLDEAQELARSRSEQELFVAGGGKVYEQVIDTADRLYLTRVDGSFAGDAYFPFVDPEAWTRKSEKYRLPDAANEFPLRFEVWRRRS